ncbi:copper chaperone CopZ [Bacillus sp. Marseille-P3661]|uniref:copper chaperone CopZ n=1 Tax=Bacillus sp. Marseille-P3661 TaxID=1936234 RepID=UPI000C831DD5|nr:copper chaperone CopZ [Bacillus sp. Marseille-P3661]
MKTETLTVEGMSCGHCVNAVESSLKEIGVVAKVDLGAKTVTVSYDESKVSLDKIKETIDDQGYDVK